MAQVKETAVVYSQEELAPEIFSMDHDRDGERGETGAVYFRVQQGRLQTAPKADQYL